MSCEDVNWKLFVWYKTEIPTLLQHTYLTGTYYVDLAGCGFMLRRCHCTWASLTHAIPVSHGHTRGVFRTVTDVRVLFSRQSRTYAWYFTVSHGHESQILDTLISWNVFQTIFVKG